MRRGKRRRSGDGCGYLLFVCVIACILLIVNAILLRAVYAWCVPHAPDFVGHPRFGRAVLFVGPIVMLVAEWTLVDRILDLVGRTPDQDQA